MAEAKAMFKSVTGSLQAYAGALMAMLGQNPGIVVEPFARSASLAMNYGNETHVIINDKFKPIAAIYKACADEDVYEYLVERFSKADKSKETRDQYLQDLKNDSMMYNPSESFCKRDLEEFAFKAMYILSTGFNHGWNGFSNLLNTNTWRAEVLAGLQYANAMMRHGEVKSDDGVKIVHEYSQVEGAAILIDPPFLYRDKGVKAKDYEIEFASLWDHARLLNVMRGATARVVLVGYRPKNVPCLYDILSSWEGSKWHCYKLSDKKNKAQRLKYGEKHKNCELYLWCNFELPDICKFYMSSRDHLEPLNFQQYCLKMLDAIETGVVKDADADDFKKMVHRIWDKRDSQDVKSCEWNLDVNVYEKITEV